jgi:hypothetical protein
MKFPTPERHVARLGHHSPSGKSAIRMLARYLISLRRSRSAARLEICSNRSRTRPWSSVVPGRSQSKSPHLTNFIGVFRPQVGLLLLMASNASAHQQHNGIPIRSRNASSADARVSRTSASVCIADTNHVPLDVGLTPRNSKPSRNAFNGSACARLKDA